MWREIPAHHHHHHHHDLGGQSHLLDTYPTPPYPLPQNIPKMNSAETLELYSSPQTSTMQQIDLNVEEEITSSFGTLNKDLCDGLSFSLLEIMPYVWYFFITSIRQSCKTFLPETRHDIE